MRKLAVVMAMGAACLLAGLAGCEELTGEKKPTQQPIEYTLLSPYKQLKTLAVTPAVNQSGTRDFNSYSVSDALFEELQQVGGLNVLPLNKTLAAMQRLGITTIDSVAMAQKVAETLNADGLIIPAITAYDPYNPPKVGMVLQLYTPRHQEGGAVISEKQPVSQVAGVFNASNQSVLRELRDFAQGRTQQDSALQDEKWLMDADAYTRFVCHAMVRRLMDVERARAAGR